MAKRKNSQEPENRPATGKTPEQSREPKKAAAGAMPEPGKDAPGDVIETTQKLKEAQEKLTEIKGILTAREGFKIESTAAILYSVASMTELMQKALQAANNYLDAKEWDAVRDTISLISHIAKWLDEIKALSPYLAKELSKPEYNGATFDDLLNIAEFDRETGQPAADSLFMKALTAARAARAAAEETPRATVTRAEIIEYPLDKPNSIIWNLLEKDTRGQVSFNMAKYGSKQEILTLYSIDFDELDSDVTITKRLTPFDKRVYIAVSALFNAGNTVITLSQIYYAMGYTGRPGTNDLTRINSAVTKMTTARIYFDNEQEATKYKYARFKYDGSLLPLERGTVIVNGQLADAAIKIFREPPLISFAKQRRQITTLDIKLLQSPISKTDANLLIDDYLIERISKAKNRKDAHSCRILFKTLYEHTGIETKKQRQRTPEKINKYLTYYQQQGFIANYTIEADRITVFF